LAGRKQMSESEVIVPLVLAGLPANG
jgi:hypothetical protein